MEFKVTMGELNTTFGNIVDYVTAELSEKISGWTHYDVVNYNRRGDVTEWELHLENHESDEPVFIASVHIVEYYHDDETDDDHIIADVTVEKRI